MNIYEVFLFFQGTFSELFVIIFGIFSEYYLKFFVIFPKRGNIYIYRVFLFLPRNFFLILEFCLIYSEAWECLRIIFMYSLIFTDYFRERGNISDGFYTTFGSFLIF